MYGHFGVGVAGKFDTGDFEFVPQRRVILDDAVMDDGDLRRGINVYVNGEDVRFKRGLETALSAGDEVSIVPAVAGGRA